jgi:hypothetical protein
VHGTADAPPPGPCAACGAALAAEREEALLDLEAQRGDCPRHLADVTVRYSVPGDARALAAAADCDGAVNAAAEADKRRRYPGHRAPWPLLPLAHEPADRLGQAALRHLRWLARDQAQSLGDGQEAAAAASALTRRWGTELSVVCAVARQLRHDRDHCIGVIGVVLLDHLFEALHPQDARLGLLEVEHHHLAASLAKPFNHRLGRLTSAAKVVAGNVGNHVNAFGEAGDVGGKYRNPRRVRFGDRRTDRP